MSDRDSRRRVLRAGMDAAALTFLGVRGPTMAAEKSNSKQTNYTLPSFEYRVIETTGARIKVASRGSGTPLLLLHGYPESHVMWRDVAPALSRDFLVVCPDLRGYGDSSKPEGLPDHSNYSKRAMALDMLEVMAALGHRQFLVAGHDRGGRVAYRLALDHPEAVKRLALLDIVSTRAVYDEGGTPMAVRYFHWFFLIQPRPFPEHLIAADPTYWLRSTLPSQAPFDEYLRTFGTPEGIHAACEDYRAGFGVDLPIDRADLAAGRKIRCPTLILWGKHGAVGAVFQPLETWRDLVEKPTGQAIDSGHFIPEENPADTERALREFFLA